MLQTISFLLQCSKVLCVEIFHSSDRFTLPPNKYIFEAIVNDIPTHTLFLSQCVCYWHPGKLFLYVNFVYSMVARSKSLLSLRVS